MKKWWIAPVSAVLAIGMVAGISVAAASGSSSQGTAQVQEQDVQEPSYQTSIQVPDPEPKDLNGLAKVTAEQAKEAALSANPGSTITKVELDNENGSLVWGVELSNGADVKVDAGNGQVVHTEQPDLEEAGEERGETETSEVEAGTSEIQGSPAGK
ncbi:MAG: PepSY domain-containing protein [Actinomycetota bacterium]|nr:PepSY domain-containing protein [Actinomycetota bacterium]